MTLLLRTMTAEPGVFASPEAETPLLPAGKPFAALCLMALEPSGVTREDLIAFLWPGAPAARSRASVRQALHVLRKAVDGEVIREEGSVLTVDQDRIRIDVSEIDLAIAEGRLDGAHALWGSGPFAHFSLADAPAFNEWGDALRGRYERRLGHALAERATAHVAEGDLEGALRAARMAEDVCPYDEATLVQVVGLLLDLGRLEEAEDALSRARSVIDEPSPSGLPQQEERLRVLRRQRAEGGRDANGHPTLPFVGRHREMAALRAHWRTVLTGRPRTVALLGEPGIGKSRLAQEFIDHALGPDAQVVRIKGMVGERSLRYGMIAELAKELAGRRGAAGISNASLATLHQLVPSLEGGSALPGAATPPSDVALADALVDLADAVGSETPLVFLVDDLQWVDAPSRILLLRLARSLRGIHALTLITCRSGDTDATAVQGLRNEVDQGRCDLIELAPLSVPELREALDLSVSIEPPDAAEEAAERLRAASRGNPLFLGELLRLLAEQSVLRRVDGGWCLDASSLHGELPLPTTAYELLEQRIAELPGPALDLLGRLARADAPVEPERLVAGLDDDPQEAQAFLGLIVRQGLVTADSDGKLDLAHDTLRDVVRRSARERARRRDVFRWDLAVGMVAMVLLVSLGLRQERGPTPAAFFGGGSLLVAGQGTVTRLRVPARRGAGWVGEELLRVPDSMTVVEVHAPPGERARAWVHTSGGGGRYIAFEYLGERGVRPVLEHQGDVVINDVSPDGGHALLGVADEARGPWHLDLVRLNLATGDTAHLYEPVWGLSPRWLPDGSGILAGTGTSPDTLLVLGPDGSERVRQIVPGFSDDLPPTPCGPGLALVPRLPPGRPAHFELVSTETGEVRILEPAVAATGSTFACPTSGGVVAYVGLVDGERRIVLQDLAAGDTLLGPPGVSTIVEWQDAEAAPVPVQVVAAQSVLHLAWGQETRPAALVRLSDGTLGEDPRVRWTSSDPQVAYVGRDGRVFGNGPGRTLLVADVHGWLRDTVEVFVGSEPSEGGVLLADRFETLDSTRWRPLGDPTARAIRQAGTPVLELLGDGIGQDGIGTRAGFDLSRGGTLEFSFRLPLTRRDRQRISACLMERPAEASTGLALAPLPEGFCFAYPAGELAAFGPEAFAVTTSVPTGRVSVPDAFPTDGWTHVAMVIAPDGEGRILINGEEAMRTHAPLRNPPGARWEIELTGRAADTRLFVRDLVLREGIRY